jgi:hypothetical protein
MNMRNKVKYIVIPVLMVLIVSCEINDPILIPDDIGYVAFSDTEQSVRENKGNLDITVYLATLATNPAEFTFSASTEGIDNPAIEGVDYNIPAGGKVSFAEGMGYQTISIGIIDNAEKDGMKQFWLILESGTEGYDIGIDGKEKVLITIQDDEHPLKLLLGTYRIEAVSFYGSVWDIRHERLRIEPDADTSKIQIYNVIEGITPVLSRPLIGTVDRINKTITIKGGQQWSNPKSNGYYFAFYKGDPVNYVIQGTTQCPTVLDEDFVLAYATDAGTVITGFDNWGPKWMEPDGEFDSMWWWDFYNSATLTKVEDY